MPGISARRGLQLAPCRHFALSRTRNVRTLSAAPDSDIESREHRPLHVNARGQIVVRLKADPLDARDTAFPLGVGEY